jgi:hypothetical protein
LKLKDGYIGINPDGSWIFDAKLAVWDDYYDFNKSNHRDPLAEYFTKVGRGTQGRNFDLRLRGNPISIKLGGKIK